MIINAMFVNELLRRNVKIPIAQNGSWENGAVVLWLLIFPTKIYQNTIYINRVAWMDL